MQVATQPLAFRDAFSRHLTTQKETTAEPQLLSGRLHTPHPSGVVTYSRLGSLESGSQLSRGSGHAFQRIPLREGRHTSGGTGTSVSGRKAIAASAAAEDGMGESTKVVEHIVYFKVKEDAAAEKVIAMVSALRALASLEGVVQLNVGEALKIPNVESSGWTHALHGRYVSKEALNKYSASDEHVKVVNELVKPIIEDIMAVDWEVELRSPPADPGVGIVHSAAMKLKEGTKEEEIAAMVDGLRGHEGTIPGLRQVSIGPNFAPARSKGHDWGFVSYHGNREDLRAYATNPEHFKVMKESVFPLVEKSYSVDFYVDVPPTSKI